MLKDFYIELKKLNFTQTKQEFYTTNLTLFEEIISIFLSQNTKWDKVLNSLKNLQTNEICEKNILKCDLATLIKPSGFYNTKAKKIIDFFSKINEDYLQNGLSLKECINLINKDYLLSIKGVFEHTADMILCLIKEEDTLIIDSDFLKIASYLGYELETYSQVKELFTDAIFENMDELMSFYQAKSINELMVMIYFGVGRFCKEFYTKKDFTPQAKEILNKAL